MGVRTWVLLAVGDQFWVTVEISFEYGSRWRSGLGFNFVSSFSVIWVSVLVLVGVESGGAVEIILGLRLNRLG